MWQWLADNKGKLCYDHGDKKIFANADRTAFPEQDEHKTKSVRKLVRAIIEAKGGDGNDLKDTRISSNYGQGIVRWKTDEEVWEVAGEYCVRGKRMVLHGMGLQLEDAFLALMGQN